MDEKRALVASIVRLFYSFIDKGSRDATFDLTRVGVCTYVTLPPSPLPTPKV